MLLLIIFLKILKDSFVVHISAAVFYVQSDGNSSILESVVWYRGCRKHIEPRNESFLRGSNVTERISTASNSSYVTAKYFCPEAASLVK